LIYVKSCEGRSNVEHDAGRAVEKLEARRRLMRRDNKRGRVRTTAVRIVARR